MKAVGANILVLCRCFKVVAGSYLRLFTCQMCIVIFLCTAPRQASTSPSTRLVHTRITGEIIARRKSEQDSFRTFGKATAQLLSRKLYVAESQQQKKLLRNPEAYSFGGPCRVPDPQTRDRKITKVQGLRHLSTHTCFRITLES